MRWFGKSDSRSFYFLNATQFLGALNDNVFKLLVIYLLINVKGPAASSGILAIAGAVFVIPFLLFSAGAGVLADRISKTKIVRATKVLELIIMLYGVLAIYLQWEFGSYLALFLMATQSALFGPSKYGIIPELVEPSMISKANGSLTSLTYLSIIIGTFLASFITDITNKNFVFEAWFCVLVAVIGLCTSLAIKKTEPQQSKKKINPIFFYEIYQTVRQNWSIPYLMTCIFGSAFFLFIGSFTQLNIIPFAMQSLHLSEVGGGYLFLATAVGIAMGALIAGHLSKEKVEPGLAVISGFFISIFFFTLYLFSSSLTCTIISLTLLGIFGGCFLIPFDAFIQTNSPDKIRGQIIAASNFFSFVGVLGAAIILYLFSEEWSLQATTGFLLMGIFTLFANIFILGRLSSFFLNFVGQKIKQKFVTLKIDFMPAKSDIIVIQKKSWITIFLLYSLFPQMKTLFSHRFFCFPWINGWFDSFYLLPSDPKKLERVISEFAIKKEPLCLFFNPKKDDPNLIKKYQNLFNKYERPFAFAETREKRSKSRFLFFTFQKKEITMTLSR